LLRVRTDDEARDSVLRLDDPDDPRLAPYRSMRERDMVGRQGLFIVEGEVVLRTALRTGRHALQSILLAEKRMKGLAETLAAVPADVPVFVASQAVLDTVVGFHIHRGVLAVGQARAPQDPDDMLAALPERTVVLGLMGIGNHDNVGGIFRNAAAFGVGAVVLDSGCCDPLYRKAIRVSVGASLTVPFVRLEPAADLPGLFARHRFETLALSPAGDLPLARLAAPARAAVLLGAEGPGLPPDVLARCRCVGIPMASGFDSLNVATTSGIVLHHLSSAGPGATPRPAPHP
jgi:tRNA G18 (ribose-2'-O)-methylase SpoU